MCYGHIDAKVLEREIADRVRAAQAHEARDGAPEGAVAPAPRPAFGLAGLWASVLRRSGLAAE